MFTIHDTNKMNTIFKEYIPNNRHLNEIRFRNAWANLGSLKRHEAMQAFIEEVVKVMPHLRAYLESLKEEREEEERRL